MPLILIVGLPSSGKTTRGTDLKEYLEKEGKTVHLISDNELLNKRHLDKNSLVFDAQKEKEIRGLLKSEVLRILSRDNVVILDAGNYIKGYRYELYCATKNSKTTQLTVETISSKNSCWAWNCERPETERYTKEAFDALHLRYEAPDSRNRWDSPLVVLEADTELNGQLIFDTLFHRKPPPPNQSTQMTPLSSADFLYEFDKITQEIVNAILSAKKLGLSGPNLKLQNFGDCILEDLPDSVTPVQLAKLRRQFLNYVKLHPPASQDGAPSKTAGLFVQFLNTTLKQQDGNL